MSGVSAALNCDLSADRHVGIFLAKCNDIGRWRFLQMALGISELISLALLTVSIVRY